MPYNPFQKRIEEKLTLEDLNALIKDSVAEGYFVEYKSILPDSKKIAKSIASFANTYGGWYIVGVTTDGHNVAANISGFSLDDTRDPIARVRDSVRFGVDPVPVFFPQVVELTEKLVVLVVYVPGEQDTPFITKDGRIYRRVHDSSEPLQEAQRFSIDRLVDLGREKAKEFRQFCQDNRAFSKGTANDPWINIFISPYPLGRIENYGIASKDGLERILQRSLKPIPLITVKGGEEKPGMAGSIPFHQGMAMANSIFLKQISQNADQIFNNSLSMEIFADGRARFFIPLLRTEVIEENGVIVNVNSQKVRKCLEKYYGEDNDLYQMKFFQLTQLWQIVLILSNFYLDCIKDDLPLIHEFRVAMHGSNLWHTVGFVDHDRWAEHVGTFHLPVMSYNEITTPDPIKGGAAIDISESPEALWGSLIGMIGMVFGFPNAVLGELIGTFLKEYKGSEQ